MNQDDLRAFLEQFNNTELAAIAAANELEGFHPAGTTKGYPREVMIQALIDLEAPKMEPPVMNERRRINAYVTKRAARFRSQAPYPQCFECIAGKVDRKDNTFKRCSDVQAMDCFLKNRDRIP